MSGLLVAVVGPSGVGKDTLLAGLAQQRPDIVIARRVITRSADAGGEDHDAVSDAEFDDALAQGHFAVHWAAHGLRYGIPASINTDLAQGRVVLFNGSRKALPAIRRSYPGMMVLMITAPQAVLAERLRARGREDAEEITARLARADLKAPAGAVTICNDASPEVAIDRMLAAITRAREHV